MSARRESDAAVLAEMIELSEQVDWRTVPEISAVTAATWNQRLREALQEERSR